MSYKDTICKVGIDEGSVAAWRDAKFYGSSGEDTVAYKGYLLLTEQRVVFVSKKGFLKPIKIRYDMAVSKIKSISKLPLTNHFIIYASTAEGDSGFIKKMFSSKNAQVHMKDGKSFIDELVKINPSINQKG